MDDFCTLPFFLRETPSLGPFLGCACLQKLGRLKVVDRQVVGVLGEALLSPHQSLQGTALILRKGLHLGVHNAPLGRVFLAHRAHTRVHRAHAHTHNETRGGQLIGQSRQRRQHSSSRFAVVMAIFLAEVSRRSLPLSPTRTVSFARSTKTLLTPLVCPSVPARPQHAGQTVDHVGTLAYVGDGYPSGYTVSPVSHSA